MDRIEHERLLMHSRSYFWARSVLIALGGLLVIGSAVLVAGMVVFRLRAQGLIDLPCLHRLGIMGVVRVFPWIVLVIAFLFIVAASWYVYHFTTAYRRSFLLILLGFIGVVLMAGALIDATPIPCQLHCGVGQWSACRLLPSSFTPQGSCVVKACGCERQGRHERKACPAL